MGTSAMQNEAAAIKRPVEKLFLLIAIVMILYAAFYGFFTVLITFTALTYLETGPGLGFFGLIFGLIMLLVTLFYLYGAYGLWKRENYQWKVVVNILFVIAIPTSLYLTGGFQDGQFNPGFFVLGMTTPVNFVIAGILFKFRKKFNSADLRK